MGRIRKSTSLKIRNGSYRADVDPAPGTELRLEGAVVMPANLDETAAGLWRTVIEPLASSSVVQKSDEPMAIMLCEMFGLYRQAYEAAKSDPLDKDNRISVTCYYEKFTKLAARFGLTPADRASVGGLVTQAAEFEQLDKLYG